MIIENYDVRCDHCGRQPLVQAGSETKARRIVVNEHLWEFDEETGDKCYECCRKAERAGQGKGESL